MKILAIDPSVNNVGIAWHDNELGTTKSSLFKPTRHTMPCICHAICSHLALTVLQKGERPDFVILEYPQWEASERGLIAMQKGYTLDLAFIVGFIAGRLNLAPANILVPTPRDWKKNIPKAATELRVKRYFGSNLRAGISEHEYDALGLILWYLKGCV